MAVVLFNVRSKFLTKLLYLSIQAFDLSITYRALTGTNPDLPFAFFSALDGLGDSLNLILLIIAGYTFSNSVMILSGCMKVMCLSN